MIEFKENEYVRIKKTGMVVKLQDINPDPNFDPKEESWADGWGESGSVIIDSPDEVEKIDAAPPSTDDIGKTLARMLCASEGDLDIHETYWNGESVEVAARWQGIPITFAVIPTHIFEEAL